MISNNFILTLVYTTQPLHEIADQTFFTPEGLGIQQKINLCKSGLGICSFAQIAQLAQIK